MAKKPTGKAAIIIFGATVFLLGARFGYWIAPTPYVVTCGHCVPYKSEEVKRINEETDKWLTRLDKELDNE